MAEGIEALLDQETPRVPLEGQHCHLHHPLTPALQLLVDALLHEELKM